MAIEIKGFADKAEFFEDANSGSAQLLDNWGGVSRGYCRTYGAAPPKAPWKQLAGTHDKLIHFYEGVDEEV